MLSVPWDSIDETIEATVQKYSSCSTSGTDENLSSMNKESGESISLPATVSHKKKELDLAISGKVLASYTSLSEPIPSCNDGSKDNLMTEKHTILSSSNLTQVFSTLPNNSTSMSNPFLHRDMNTCHEEPMDYTPALDDITPEQSEEEGHLPPQVPVIQPHSDTQTANQQKSEIVELEERVSLQKYSEQKNNELKENVHEKVSINEVRHVSHVTDAGTEISRSEMAIQTEAEVSLSTPNPISLSSLPVKRVTMDIGIQVDPVEMNLMLTNIATCSATTSVAVQADEHTPAPQHEQPVSVSDSLAPPKEDLETVPISPTETHDQFPCKMTSKGSQHMHVTENVTAVINQCDTSSNQLFEESADSAIVPTAVNQQLKYL